MVDHQLSHTCWWYIQGQLSQTNLEEDPRQWPAIAIDHRKMHHAARKAKGKLSEREIYPHMKARKSE